MRSTTLACELLLLAASVHGYLEIPIVKKRNGEFQRLHRDLSHTVKRQNSSYVETNVFDVLTWANGGAYYLNITVGTPPQAMTVILDTGSSDLYLDASSAQECQTTGARACKGGTFDSSSSTTYTVLEPAPAFNTSFGDGSTAEGPFGGDVVCLSDICIDDVQFGLATDVNSTTGFAIGLMGIGYSAIEGTQTHYPNMPEILVDAGEINSRLYSLYLNDQADLSGSILFGAIDTSKYTGDLQLVNILPDPALKIEQFITTITAIKTTVSGTASTVFSGGSPGVGAYTNNNSIATLLDSGSSAFYMPPTAYQKLLGLLPFSLDQYGTVDCSHTSDDVSLTITFADTIDITVPFSEILAPLYNSTSRQPLSGSNGGQLCTLLITPQAPSQSEPFLITGDAVLRSMYVVYDLDNAQMGIAQAKVGSTATPNIKAVPAGPGGIAKVASEVQTVAPPSSTFPIASAVAVNGTFTVSTASATIGTATGLDAVPPSARPTGSGAAGASSSASASSSSGAVPGVVVPGGFGWAFWVQGFVVLLGAGAGAWLVV